MTRSARLARLAASGVLSLLLASQNAWAEYQHRVLLLEREGGDDADREITTRVRAELTAAGFEVVVLPVSEQDPKQAVESAGHELHPASVLLVERLLSSSSPRGPSSGSELWLADRMLDKTVVLRLKAEATEPRAGDATGGSRQAARVAVQAVELVKARLAELSLTREHARAPTPAPPTPPTAALAATRQPRSAHPNLTLGVGVLEGFQKGQHAFTPLLRLGVALPERVTGQVLGIDVRGGFVGLGRAARVEHGPGAATLRHTAATVDAVVRFLPQKRAQPFVSLGAGMLALDVTGDAPEPYRNSSARTLSGLVDASGGIWLEPLAGVGIVLEGQLMSAWSKTVVRIAGQDAAEVAAPLLLLSGGLMVEF
jgi:hypothetical protein